jgi:hypothetical protein
MDVATADKLEVIVHVTQDDRDVAAEEDVDFVVLLRPDSIFGRRLRRYVMNPKDAGFEKERSFRTLPALQPRNF